MEKKHIKAWAEDDRPREKMLRNGAKTLSLAELLAILIGSGSTDESAVALMQRILADCNQQLSQLSQRSVQELCHYKGIGPAKAITLAAACELAVRRMEESASHEIYPRILASKDIFTYFYPLMCDLAIEECWVMMLNQANRVIGRVKISMGGLTATAVDLRCVLRESLLYRATSIILVHNHPSGNTQPSADDNRLTHRLTEAARAVDIRLLDHLVWCESGYYSYADEGQIE